MVYKTFKELAPHYSQGIQDKVVERERDNDDNDEYVYYSFMEIAPAKIRGCCGMGLGVWGVDGL